MEVINIVPSEVATYGDNEVIIDDCSITYIQNADCSGLDKDEIQSITLSTRNNGITRFINIKTDGWSIDGIDSLKLLIEDFSKRAELNLTNN